jgi:hypothetical protein
MPERLESEIESKVVDYAKSKGCMERKMNGPGYRGWPDRLFMYNGKVVWVEFKRLGEEPTNLQRFIHGRLRDNGFDVEVVDNVLDGCRTIDNFIANSTDF